MTSLMAWLRRARVVTLGVLLSVCLGVAAQAQNYPDRPIRLIAPFPAGGLADVLARAVGDEISRTLGQPVIVENRAGAGGNIGADAVAKSTPDGYTLLMTSAGILTANQFLYATMPFDPEKDFVPVSNVADMPMMVVVNPKVEAKTLAGTGRAGARQSRQAQFRLARHRHHRTSGPRDVHACGQDQAHACAVSRAQRPR